MAHAPIVADRYSFVFMSVRISRQTIPFQTERVDWISPDDPRYSRFACYPHPALMRTGEPLMVDLQVVQIENSYFRIQIAPSLGGRVVSWFDLGSQLELLGPPPSALHPNESRGVELRHGIELVVGSVPRMNSLGPVDFELFEPEDEQSSGGILMHEQSVRHGISWHLSIYARPDDPRLSFECRAIRFSAGQVQTNFGLLIHSGELSQFHHTSGVMINSNHSSQQWLIESEPGEFFSSTPHENAVLIAAREPDLNWPVGQTETLTCHVAAGPENEKIDLCQNGIAAIISNPLKIWAFQPIENVPISAKCGEESLKATATASYRNPFIGRLPSEPTSLRVKLAEGEVQWPLENLTMDTHIRHRERKPCYRPEALFLRALYSSHKGNREKTLSLLEIALAHNGENHITWWAVAAFSRNLGIESEAIEQVHALAPLEPLARAEAFLSIPEQHGKDPHPLVKPLANDPDAMLEVANTLLKFGLKEDAIKWIDECLRHREIPLLRYVLAYQHLPKMKVEAASQVALVENTPLDPPYPLRSQEIGAILQLTEAFPDSRRLAKLNQILTEYAGKQ